MDHSPVITPSARTRREAVAHAEQRLRDAGIESPRAVAEWLTSAVVQGNRFDLILHADALLSVGEQQCFDAYLARALNGEPVQYIVGSTDFRGLTLKCDPRALIPRPETEQLIECVLSDPDLRHRTGLEVADIGTGTGCIALSVAQAWSHARVTAVDREADALTLARENAMTSGLAERVTFRLGALLEGFAEGSLDVVIANLPYVTTAEWLALTPGVRNFEPRTALDGGVDGLDFIRLLIRQAAPILRPRGVVYLEIGVDQGPAVLDEMANAGFMKLEVINDLAGRPRFVRGTKP